jgi:AbrB family looped-hinge helix DNA binding protein
MGKAKMDDRGRILIPREDRERLGLKAGTEFDVLHENGLLVLKPIIPKPLHVDGSHRKWGKEAFLESGQAAFGE